MDRGARSYPIQRQRLTHWYGRGTLKNSALVYQREDLSVNLSDSLAWPIVVRPAILPVKPGQQDQVEIGRALRRSQRGQFP